MKLLIVSGSQRKSSESSRIAQYLKNMWQQSSKGDADVWDLAEKPLPFWDVDMWNADSAMKKDWQQKSQIVRDAEGLVLISPEWAGIVPPALKNFLLFCSSGEIAHKPALIATVSSSRGGTYPVSELRMSGYKNSFVCFIPEHLIFREVAKFPGEDDYMVQRSNYALSLLEQYMRSLKMVRESGVVDMKSYPFGM
jgi:NAD(P)H-dependent FMN reductase